MDGTVVKEESVRPLLDRRESAAPSHAVEISRPRIVWADDNADMRDYVARLLRPWYDVEAVSDGTAALSAIRRMTPDLILADVMMPGLDGCELLRAIRADPSLADVPVVLLSARSGEESQVEGMAAGADDYLIKPFSARELAARVDAHVRLGRLRRELVAVHQRNEARLRRMINVEGLWVLLFSEDGTLIDANDEFVRRSGYTREQLASRSLTWRDMTPAEFVGISEAQMARLAETSHIGPYEKEFFRHDGSRLWMVFVGASLGDGTIAEYAIDIEDRKRAEAALRDREERQAFLLTLTDALRSLADPTKIKAAATKLLGEQLRVNRAFYADADNDRWLVTQGYERDITPLPQPISICRLGPRRRSRSSRTTSWSPCSSCTRLRHASGPSTSLRYSTIQPSAPGPPSNGPAPKRRCA